MSNRYHLTVCALAVALSLPQGVDARNLYRYKNAEGTVVVNDQVPPEYVPGGYEVLNDLGVVIKVVPRELTDEEREVHDARELLEEQARAEEERLRKWDESLLLRYSTVEDIEAARERALRELRIRVNILKSNKRALKQQVESYQAQAADIERSGREVDLERLQVIEDLQGEIAATDRAIVERQKEIEEVSASYQADIDRFEQLLEVVALRRRLLEQERQ
jgi:hypothetical protein